MKNIFLAMLAAFLLYACSTLDDDIAYFDSLSCTQLAYELGKYSERDDEVSNKAETDYDIAEYEKYQAKDRVIELKRIYAEKGCKKI